MTDQTHGLGAVPSPLDPRDFPFAALAPTRPPTKPPMPGTVPGPMPAPLDQGQTGTCVANAVVNAASILFHRKLGRWLFDERSARDLYMRATGDTTLQQGTFPRLVLRCAQKDGILGTDHKRYPIGPYHSLLPSADPQADIEHAIGVLGLPVVTAIDWPEDWMGKGAAVLPDPVGPSAGGHAIVTWRYARKHPAPHTTTWRVDDEILNSWGRAFGAKGSAYVGAGVLVARAFDLWTFTV